MHLINDLQDKISYAMQNQIVSQQYTKLNDMAADCTIINVNLQNKNAQLNKAKKQKEITFFLNRTLRPNN